MQSNVHITTFEEIFYADLYREAVIHFLRRNLFIPGANFFYLPKTGPKTTPYLEKMGSNKVDKENNHVLVNCPSSTSRKKMNDTLYRVIVT